ncbi:MAG: hypothetical protein KKF77_03005 [Proteobacteria bacterium]|nr:hypothetical protein [Pseudomonadota bacterium]
MSGALLAMLGHDLDAIFELGGLDEPVEYIPGDEDLESVTLKGFYDEAYQEVDPHSRMSIGSTGPAVHLRSTDLPEYPAETDRLVIRSRTFRITLPKPDGQGMTTFLLHEVTT